MPSFSQKSRDRLATCHWQLQDLMNEVIKEIDIIVLQGHRTRAEHNALPSGVSQVPYERSYHSTQPALAVDVAPYPIDWNDYNRFKAMGAVVKRIATTKGYKITWGGDWHSLKDYPHFQLERSVLDIAPPSSAPATKTVADRLDALERRVDLMYRQLHGGD